MKVINIPVKASSYVALCNFYNNGEDCKTKYMLTGVVNYNQGNGVAKEIYRGILAFDLSALNEYCDNIKEAYLAIYIQKVSVGKELELQVCCNVEDYNIEGVIGLTAPSFSESINVGEVQYFNTKRYIRIDIKKLVIGWLNGSIPNYGLTLKTFESELGAIQYGGVGSKNPVVLNIIIGDSEKSDFEYKEENEYCEEESYIQESNVKFEDEFNKWKEQNTADDNYEEDYDITSLEGDESFEEKQ